MKLSLETRLNLSIACILLTIIALGSVWVIRDARESVRLEARASVSLALGLIDAALRAGDLTSSGLHEWIDKVAHLERLRHLRIVVSNDAVHPALKVDQSQSRTLNAVPDWFRWAVISEPVSVVRKIKRGDESPVFVHVESYAEDEIREAWDEVRGFLFLQALLLLAIYLSVHIIAGRALRPVGRIVRSLNDMQKGDFDTRLPRFGLSELDRISDGINHLSSSLKTSRDEIRGLTRHSLAIQEEERRCIAQEIHDEFGQNLTAIKMMSRAMVGNPDLDTRADEEIQRLCDRLFSVVRSLMRRLRPMLLEDLGLKAALLDLCDHWRTTAPELEIHFQCDPALEALKGGTSLEIYRIIQEALTNTLRHSGGDRVMIQIERVDSVTILLTLRDNGRGMMVPPQKLGFGLLGMRERVASLKGRFSLINQVGQGLEIRITLPIGESPDDRACG